VESASVYYPDCPGQVQVVGTYAYLLTKNYPGALVIYDVSDKINPVVKSTMPLVSNIANLGPLALYVEPTGRYAYVTMATFNINIIDTLNKSAPVLVGVNTAIYYNYPATPYGLRDGSIPTGTHDSQSRLAK
jgi:hypothetical protein